MMNYIWAGMIILSLVFSLFSGNVQTLSNALTQGANSAVEMTLGILGIMCFWSGIMEIGKRSGVTLALSKLLRPVLKVVFPDIDAESEAMSYISLNVSANLLGLGNAATPFGLKAMKELKKLSKDGDRATDSMLVFVVMNTASVQLLPTTIAAYRGQYGSENPFDILPCVWVTSLVALWVGIGVAKLFSDKKIKGENGLRRGFEWSLRCR